MLLALRDEEMKRYVLHNERGLKAFGKWCKWPPGTIFCIAIKSVESNGCVGLH